MQRCSPSCICHTKNGHVLLLYLSRYNEDLRRKRVIKIQPSQSKQDEVTKTAVKLEPEQTEDVKDNAKRGGDVTEEIGQVDKRYYGHFPRFGLFSTSFSLLYRTSVSIFLTTYLLQEDNLETTPKKMNDKGKIFIIVLPLSKGSLIRFIPRTKRTPSSFS